jgi:hypothetical protein
MKSYAARTMIFFFSLLLFFLAAPSTFAANSRDGGGAIVFQIDPGALFLGQLAGGISYFLNSQIAFGPQIQYSVFSTEEEVLRESSIFVRLQYYLRPVNESGWYLAVSTGGGELQAVAKDDWGNVYRKKESFSRSNLGGGYHFRFGSADLSLGVYGSQNSINELAVRDDAGVIVKTYTIPPLGFELSFGFGF